MPPRKPTPSYLRHKQSGRGRATWTDAAGVARQRLLPGPFESPESKAAFHALGLELASAPLQSQSGEVVTIDQLFLAFKDHAEKHYRRPDGSATHELVEYGAVSRLLRPLYGSTPAREFGPLALKAARQAMIERGWCRSLVNQRVNRIRRVFKWAVGEELIPAAVLHALAAVAGLQRGRSQVRESEPVLPVEESTVDATLPFLPRHLRGLVEFQRLTGCRPGEACAVRRADIDTGGAVWLYRPSQHKSAWRGKSRVIAIGPQAQAVLREFFTPNLEDHLFSPRRSVEEFHAGRERRTPLYPSHAKRNANIRARKPDLQPAEKYDVTQYGQAIKRACDLAFPAPAPLGRKRVPDQRGDGSRDRLESNEERKARLTPKHLDELEEWKKSHRWHPNQLRHAFATKARKQHGLEAAQVLLGHARADVTQVYAERNLDLAVNVAAQLG